METPAFLTLPNSGILVCVSAPGVTLFFFQPVIVSWVDRGIRYRGGVEGEKRRGTRGTKKPVGRSELQKN